LSRSADSSRSSRATVLIAAISITALALSCRRSLNNPADPKAPSYGGDPVTIDAGPPASASVGDTVVLEGRFDGEASRVAEYAWDFDGDGAVDSRSANSPEGRHAFRLPGEYAARFTVRGVGGDEAAAVQSVRITDETPRGSLGADTLVAPGDTVALVPRIVDDGVIVRYEWDLDGDGAFERVEPDGRAVIVAFAADGEFVVALRVVDDDGHAATIGRRLGVCALPSEPSAVTPADGSAGVAIRQVLRWSSDGGCAGGLVHDLYVGTDDPPSSFVLGGADVPAFFAGILLHDTIYRWRVVARDAAGRRRESPVFTFRTRAEPDRMTFVPAGLILIGSDRHPDEAPVHSAAIDAYYIDLLETTRDEFATFVAATGYAPRGGFRSDYPAGTGSYPVTNVTWADASEYAAWLGKRLPTEAEWELASARPHSTIFPWGNFVPRRLCEYANIAPAGATPCVGDLSVIATHPAGASWIGAEDMCGNAAEWVFDWYGAEYYADPLAGVLPTGPSTGTRKVARGGSFRTPLLDGTTTRRRPVPPDSSADDIGFRCALSIDAPSGSPVR